MSTILKWGLIGASNIAKTSMIDAIRKQADNEVVAILSSNAKRAEEYATEYNIEKAYTTLNDMLADPDIDVVYISTTNELHKEQTIRAANAGKHVLCEKPLALSRNDAKEMIDCCRANNVILGTNHHLRNAATHIALRDLVRSGKLGKISSMRIFHAVYLPTFLQKWRVNRPDAGGGVILDITVHDADTIRFILGEDPTEIVALAQNFSMGKEVEDGVMCVLKTTGGILVQTHEAFTAPHAGTGLEIHGENGSAIAQDIMTPRPIGTIKIITKSGEKQLPVDHHNLYVRSLSKFIRAINSNNNEEASATGDDGIKSLLIALAAKQSIDTGKKVSINYDLKCPSSFWDQVW